MRSATDARAKLGTDVDTSFVDALRPAFVVQDALSAGAVPSVEPPAKGTVTRWTDPPGAPGLRAAIDWDAGVARLTDATGREVAASDIYAIFQQEYLSHTTPYSYSAHRTQEDSSRDESVEIDLDVMFDGEKQALHGAGNGPIDAFVDALGLDVKLMDYHEHAIGAGASAQAAWYVELRLEDGPTIFGVGMDSNIVTASFKAVLSAINRQMRLRTGKTSEVVADMA